MGNHKFLLVLAIGLLVLFAKPDTWAKGGEQFPFWNFSQSLFLVDSEGKKVGRVIGVNGLSSVVNQSVDVLVERRHFRFALTATGTKLAGTLPLLFESTDCSGPPLMRKDEIIETVQMFPPVALAGENTSQPGQVVYVPDSEEIPIETPAKSRIFLNEPCSPFALQFPLVNARKVADLSELAPPFDVKLNRR